MGVECGAIRLGIEARLATVSGLFEYDVQPDEAPRFPVAVVFPVPVETGRHTTDMCDGERWDFLCEVHVSLDKGLARAQRQLDAYISTAGANSIAVAIEADKTLGGEVDTLEVLGFEFYGFAKFNGTQTLAGRVPVATWT